MHHWWGHHVNGLTGARTHSWRRETEACCDQTIRATVGPCSCLRVCRRAQSRTLLGAEHGESDLQGGRLVQVVPRRELPDELLTPLVVFADQPPSLRQEHRKTLS